MSKPALQDIDVWIGNTETYRFQCFSDQDFTVPFDLTGSDLRFTLYHDGTPIVKTIGSGITVVNALTGTFDVALSKADTRAIASRLKSATYEVERMIGQTEKTFIRGLVKLDGGNNND